MPIIVKCEHCSARFQVRDVYAGKRGKCLRCRKPIVVPMGDGQAGDAFTVPAPSLPRPVAPAEPVVASRVEEEPPPVTLFPPDEEAWPKPQAVWPAYEAEYEPPPARLYPAADESRPKLKATRPAEDDAEDALSGLPRRSGVAPKPQKKRSGLPLVLLAGLVAIGGGAAGYFLLIAPKQAKATSPTTSHAGDSPTDHQPPPTTEQEPPPAETGVSETNLAKVRAGMTAAEVEAILGKGKKADTLFDIATAVSAAPNSEDATDRWNEKLKLGHVWVWNKRFDAIAVAYSGDPDAGGTVVGLVATFGRAGSEPVKLPDPSAPNPNAKPVDPKTLPGYPEATLTAAELAKDHAKYKGKWVAVTGKLKKDVPPLADDDIPTGAGVALDHPGLAIEFARPCVGRAGAKAGTEVEIWGRVDGLTPDQSAVAMSGCLCQKPAVEVEATALMDEYLKDGAAAVKKYELQPLKVSGTVADMFGRVIVGSKTGDKGVQVHCDALGDKALNLRPGDQVVVLTNHLKFFRDDKLDWKICTLWDGRVIALKR